MFTTRTLRLIVYDSITPLGMGGAIQVMKADVAVMVAGATSIGCETGPGAKKI